MVALLGVSLLEVADGQMRRAEGHQHSVATAQLALEDGGALSLFLRAPGANLVGFEHPPTDETQRERLQVAIDRLADPSWLVLPDAAGCRVDVEVTPTGFDADPHNHPHDHEHHHGHGGHAEFMIGAQAICERPEALAWAELHLFDGWPDNRSIIVDGISGSGQWRVSLDTDHRRIALR